MDWNRRHCARRGHVLYEPLEPEYRDRIRTETALGPAWRCLRCGDFALEQPGATGPAADAPLIPRGKALRSLLIMRLLAVERVFRFLLAGAAAYAVWKFSNSQRAVSSLFENDLTLFKPLATHWGYDLDHSSIVDTIRKTFNYKHSTLTVVAILLAAYALIELVEAVGLWLAKRWGEYFAVVATAAFIPIEVHEILAKQSAFKIATFALNVLAVVYLLLAKRLFGLRGGKAAAERALHSASLLEIEQAAGEPAVAAGEAGAQARAGRAAGVGTGAGTGVDTAGDRDVLNGEAIGVIGEIAGAGGAANEDNVHTSTK